MSSIYTHDLARLLRIAELDQELAEAARLDRQLELFWETVVPWSEATRYDIRRSSDDAEKMLRAISDPAHGVFAWLRQFW